MKELYEYVVNFMIENEVTCIEDIWQSGRLSHLRDEFMSDCFELVKSELPHKNAELNI